MINFNYGRVDRSTVRDVSASTVITDEGMALVLDPTAPNTVRLSTGNSTDQFCGVSISQQTNPSFFPQLETLTGVAGSITLSFTPIAGSIYAYDQTTAAALTVVTSGTPTSGQVKVVGTAVTLYSGTPTDTVFFQYRYVPTTVQAMALQGTILPGGDSGAVINKVGVLVAGDVYTSIYDTSVAWSSTAENVVKLAANGLFTTAGSGATLSPGVKVISVPSATNPYLGLSISNG